MAFDQDIQSMRKVRVALLILAGCLTAFEGPAQVCSYGNGGGSNSGGGAVLVVIDVNGDPSDWGPVLASPPQVTNDGEMCLAGTTDRDCAQPSGGRDLALFAWTWDASRVYLYMKRYGSVANQQTFYFFMDTNANQRMNTGEKVLAVDYKGSNRSTTATLYTYTAADGAAGDAMADAAGYADGYSIGGGAIGGAVALYSGIIGGFADGTGFEAYVPWSNLGVPAGTPIYFHVSSSNGSSGALIDNLGGPDGKIGAFAFRSVSVTPDSGTTTYPGCPTMVDDTKIVTNTGTLSDSYELTAHSTLGLRVDLYDGTTLMATDANGDADFADFGDYVNPSYDGNANGLPSSPLLAVSAAFAVTMRITAPCGVENVQDVTTLSAFSVADPGLCAGARTTLAIGDLTLTPTPQARSVVAGQVVDFHLILGNYSIGDCFDLWPRSSQGWMVQLFSDPNGDGSPSDGVLISIDANGNGVFTDAGDSITAGWDTNANGRPDFGTVANGSGVSFVVRLSAPAGAPDGTVDVCTVIVQGAGYGASATAVLGTTVRQRLTFSPSYMTTAGTNLYSGQGRPVYYSHTLINSWPASDTITLASTANPLGWTIQYYTDPNGDGNPADGTQITGPFALAANGGTATLVVEVVIPSGLTLPLTHTAVVTATGAGGAPAVTDEVRISYISTFSDANHAIAQRKFALCQAIYVLGSSLNPGGAYTIRYLNPSSTVIRSQAVTADGNGDAVDFYPLLSGDQRGTWTIELRNASNGLVDSLTVAVDPPTGNPSTVNPIGTGQASYSVTGDNLSLTATFNNTSGGADYLDTAYRYLVRTPDLTQYLRSDGAFASYTGAELTRSTSPHTVLAGTSATEAVTVNDITFPWPGLYRLDVLWLGSCGNTIATATLTLPVGTDLASFADVGHSVQQESFNATATVYLKGGYYLPSTAYTVAYYRPGGTLAFTHFAASTALGALSDSAAVAVLITNGTWHAVVYPAALAPPPAFYAADPAAMSVDAFVADTIPPAVTANIVTVTSSSPELTGTINDPSAAVQVTVNGSAYAAVNKGDGTWTLPAGTIAPALTPWVYDVIVMALDAAGNTGTDSTTGELTIQHTAPVVGGPIAAGDGAISGTSASPAGTTITVYEDGVPIGTATVQGDGTWTLAGVVGLRGGESITAQAGSGAVQSVLSGAVVVIPAAPAITSVLVPGSMIVAGTSTAPPGSTVTVLVDGTPSITTVQGDGTWSLTVISLAAGETVTATVTAGSAVSPPSPGVTISGIPNLLRNDIVSSLAAYDAASIFVKYPADPSLDGFGANAAAQIGEGASREANGSSDDDDFYIHQVPSGYVDDDPTVLTDPARPLVLYQLSCAYGDCILYLSKEAGSIKVTYTLP